MNTQAIQQIIDSMTSTQNILGTCMQLNGQQDGEVALAAILKLQDTANKLNKQALDLIPVIVANK